MAARRADGRGRSLGGNLANRRYRRGTDLFRPACGGPPSPKGEGLDAPAAIPVPCSLFPVPFDLPLAIPPSPRQIRICIRLNSYCHRLYHTLRFFAMSAEKNLGMADGGKSRNLQDAAGKKGAARRAAILCAIFHGIFISLLEIFFRVLYNNNHRDPYHNR